MDYDVVVVGSGPGGTATALGLSGHGLKVGLVDVGYEPQEVEWPNSFDDALIAPTDWRSHLLGEAFEYLEALHNDVSMAKFRAPFQAFVTKNMELTPVRGHGFTALVSHAMGGLANLWGAQMLRYDDEDLAEFPITAKSLAPHYDVIEQEMGISGSNDDLTRFYGKDPNLLPPLKLNPNASDLLHRYTRQRKFLNKRGVFIGHPRTSILTEDNHQRTATSYDGLEFFRPSSPSLYTPAFTLKKLIDSGHVTYMPGLLATQFADEENGASVRVRDIHDGGEKLISARKLVLAAGALGSARLALVSGNNDQMRLPLLDNPLSYIPLINPMRLGRTQDPKTSYLQLNLCFRQKDTPLTMGSFYAINGLLHSDFACELPLKMADNLRLIPHIVPAVLILHLWYHDEADVSKSWVQIDRDKVLHVHGKSPLNGALERKLIWTLLRLGFFSLPGLVQYPQSGNSFHRCGTLPMRENPGPYETAADGRLGSARNIFVTDASIFPSLSAKNLSLTIMANAHRVSKNLVRAL